MNFKRSRWDSDLNKISANGKIIEMELREIGLKDENLADIKSLYLKAFPNNERKSFKLILEKVSLGQMKIYGAFDNGFVGEAIMILDDDLALLDYLAIAENVRSKGYGSKILKELLKIYQKERLFLEIESTVDQNPLKLKRKNFYLKNGFKVLDFEVMLFGVRMELLSDGSIISYEEYFNIYRHLFSSYDLNKIYKLEK